MLGRNRTVEGDRTKHRILNHIECLEYIENDPIENFHFENEHIEKFYIENDPIENVYIENKHIEF